MSELNSENSAAIVSEFVDDPDMTELIEMFVSELPEKIEAIRAACANADLETVRQVAHQLKGAGGGYGYPMLTTAAAELEASAKTAAAVESIRREVETMTELCARVQAGLHQT